MRSRKFTGRSYPGGQNGSGHYQILINHIPKSDVYVEAFLGYSGVFNNITMSPGAWYFGFDRDQRVIDAWAESNLGAQVHFAHCDYTAAKLVLSMFPGRKVFIHLDPPYRNTKSPKKYLYDINDDPGFIEFLNFVLSMSGSCNVMVSHWKDDLFDEYLCSRGGFTFIGFKTMSRRGLIDNGIYINYDAGKVELADLSYVGSDYTDRQRVKRKVDRNYKKIMAMPARERELLLALLLSVPADIDK